MAQSNLLDQFRALISKSPLPLSTDRLVQVGDGKYLIKFEKYFPLRCIEKYFPDFCILSFINEATGK